MPKANPKGKTLADFRAAHDRNVIVPTKIRAALSKLATEHAENWVYEADLLKLAGISTTDIGLFRDQFVEHIVETAGRNAKRVWFATIKAAKVARGD